MQLNKLWIQHFLYNQTKTNFSLAALMTQSKTHSIKTHKRQNKTVQNQLRFIQQSQTLV